MASCGVIASPVDRSHMILFGFRVTPFDGTSAKPRAIAN
jgi:hypothetical protein